MNALQIPKLIEPYAPLCPDGANAILELARDLRQRVVSDMAYDILTRFADQPVVGYALLYAAARHHGDVYEQSYGDVPYLYHLLDVAWCLAFTLEINHGLTIACGLLHDLLEDEKATTQELSSYLSSLPEITPGLEIKILEILQALIRPDEKNDQVTYYSALSQAPSEARLVKTADLICNTASLKAKARDWFQAPPAGSPKPHLIAKYVIESEKYVLEKPAYCSLENYPLIHNTLLGVLQDLLDQLALRRYHTGFRAAALHIQYIHFI
jgi:hypothetical protein